MALPAGAAIGAGAGAAALTAVVEVLTPESPQAVSRTAVLAKTVDKKMREDDMLAPSLLD